MEESYFWTLYKEFDRIKNKYYDPSDPVSKLSYKDPKKSVRLHFGFVTDNEDPAKLGRVKVHFPIWADNIVSNWIPLLHLYSSEEHGIWYIPDVGDKVLCGFINDNPSKPYVIGSFYHPKAKPPVKDNKKNNIKGFFTKGGIKVVIDDTEGEERIEISMKDGKMRLLLDKNEGVQFVNELGDVKIKCRKLMLESEETLNIKGNKGVCLKSETGSISFNAKKDLNIKSSKEAVFKGNKINLNGSTGVTAGNKQIALRMDQVMGIDKHDIKVPSKSGTKTVYNVPHPFVGTLQSRLSTNVDSNNRAVATKGSIAKHVTPGHIPTPPGIRFKKPPMSQGEVTLGTIHNVKVNDKEIAVVGSQVKTCNDPIDQETCKIYTAGVAVTLPILMPGTDPLVMETQGGLVTSARSFIRHVKKLSQPVKKSINNAKWGKTKIKKGEKVELKVSLVNQVFGSSVYFKIFEEGANTEVDKPIKKVIGHHKDGKASATTIFTKPAMDAEEDELKYFFTAQSLNCGITESGPITVEKVKPEFTNMKWYSIPPEEDENDEKQSNDQQQNNGEEEINEIEYGYKVKLKADVKNIDDGKNIKLTIYEKGYEEKNQQVHQDYVKLKDGKIEYEWKPVTSKKRLGELEENDELKFVFVLEVYNVKSDKSEDLQVTFWMEINVIADPETMSLNDAYILKSVDGSKYSMQKKIRDDKIPGDDMITLHFDKLKPGLKYNMEFKREKTGDGHFVFEDVEFVDLLEM